MNIKKMCRHRRENKKPGAKGTGTRGGLVFPENRIYTFKGA
jgi:hypothetical protein